MNRRKRLLIALGSGSLIALFILVLASFVFRTSNTLQTESIAMQSVSSDIIATGSVASENEAMLHFQTGGKLAVLNVREGDHVYAGETIASLDTYALQQQLAQAVNNYKIAQSTLDQTQENKQVGLGASQQRTSFDTTGGHSVPYTNTTEETVVQDAVNRIIEQGQLNANSASLSVAISQYAVQLASIQTPISGVVTHEDVTTAGVNISPETSFVIDDPTDLVFKANVSQNDIDFVSLGSHAQIMMNGKTVYGSVIKIYPQKQTLPNGDNVYVVDIATNSINNRWQLGQTGSVVIESNTNADVMLVPSWVVLGHKYVWVVDNGKAKLRTITLGKNHGSLVEIISGLLPTDKVVVDPKSIAKNSYRIL